MEVDAITTVISITLRVPTLPRVLGLHLQPIFRVECNITPRVDHWPICVIHVCVLSTDPVLYRFTSAVIPEKDLFRVLGMVVSKDLPLMVTWSNIPESALFENRKNLEQSTRGVT